jgi:DNA-binding HxlR family transcriptional regulator
VRTYGQYCPIAKAAEALGDRWTLLIVREMLHGTEHFNDFERNLPGISRSVLAQRLRQLERIGLLERQEDDARRSRYVLTRAGRDLTGVLDGLGEWGGRWLVTDPSGDEVDPYLLMLFLSRHLHTDRLPTHRVVLAFTLHADRSQRFWLVVEDREASLCLKDPGFACDAEVEADTAALYRVYLGGTDLDSVRRAGLVRLHGPRTLVRSIPGWFAWSRFADAVRAGAADPVAGVQGPS